MIQEGTELVVADNTGAKLAMCFRIIGQRKRYAHIGDVIKVAVKEALPTGASRLSAIAWLNRRPSKNSNSSSKPSSRRAPLK